MARTALAPVTQWITAAAVRHGAGLAAHVMDRLGLARRPALALLRRLADAGWLQIEGTPRRRHYAPGPLRQVVQRYALDGLQEDAPWRRDFAPFFVLPAAVQRMAQHAYTGEATIIVRNKANMMIIAEKTFMDTTYLAGKFGQYTYSQVGACFSDYKTFCLE